MVHISSYLLVTPVRNESDQLDDLAATIRAQELRPRLWVIVDDGSSDGTEERLRRLRARDPWIMGVTLPRAVAAGPRRRAELVIHGFAMGAQRCEAEGRGFDFAVNLDADLRCPPHLLAELIGRVEGARTLGIASCAVAEVAEDGQVLRHREVIDGIPGATLRVWRRDCFEEVAMHPSPRWAEATGVRARNRGWQTAIFTDLRAEAARPGMLKDGGWSGLRDQGAESWLVGVHPLVMAGQAMAASMNDRDLRGVAMVAGYVEAAISGQPRSQDPELRDYFGDDLLRLQARTLLARVPVVGRRFRRSQ